MHNDVYMMHHDVHIYNLKLCCLLSMRSLTMDMGFQVPKWERERERLHVPKVVMGVLNRVEKGDSQAVSEARIVGSSWFTGSLFFLEWKQPMMRIRTRVMMRGCKIQSNSWDKVRNRITPCKESIQIHWVSVHQARFQNMDLGFKCSYCKEDLRYEFQLLLFLLLLLPVMMMMMVIPSPINTDNLLSRENLEIFLSFYQELQTK